MVVRGYTLLAALALGCFLSVSCASARAEFTLGNSCLGKLEFPAIDQKLRSEELAGLEIMRQLAGNDVAAFGGLLPELRIVEFPQPNAFAKAPGGVVLTSGLLDLIQSPSELAFAVAHELAHLKLHGAGHGGGKETLETYLSHEREADELAIELMAQAGFNVEASVQLLHKLAAFGHSGHNFAALYPTLGRRILGLEQQLAQTAV